MDRKITDTHLSKIAKFLPKWKVVARLLGLEGEMVIDIEDRIRDGEDQRLEALWKWVRKEGLQATYKKLYEVLREMEEGEAAEKVKELTRDVFPLPDAHPLPLPAPSVQRPMIPALDPECKKALESSIKKLEKQFRDVVKAIQKDCEHVDIGDIKISTTLIPVAKKQEHTSFLNNQNRAIAQASSIIEIITLLNMYWDYINYDILELLVNEFGCTQTKQLMEQFLHDVNVFMADTMLAEFIHTCSGMKDIPPDFHQLTVRYKLDPNKTTLQYLDEFRKDFCQQYSLHGVVMIFRRIYFGSVEVVWLIPSHVVEHLCAEIKNPEVGYKMLTRYKVLKILINGMRVFACTTEENENNESKTRTLLQTDSAVEKETEANGLEFQSRASARNLLAYRGVALLLWDGLLTSNKTKHSFSTNEITLSGKSKEGVEVVASIENEEEEVDYSEYLDFSLHMINAML